MRLLPGIRGTTLDSFHRDVYRPRLALLLLIVLLIFGQNEASRNQNENGLARLSSKKTKDTRLSVDQNMKVVGKAGSETVAGRVQSLLDKLPRSLRNDKSTIAIQYVDGQPVAAARKVNKGAEVTSLKKKTTGGSTHAKVYSKRRTDKDSTGSILNRALNAEALSAMVSLHALWIIRLGSMVIEDNTSREIISARDSRRPSSKRATFSAIFALLTCLALALIAASASWVDQLERWRIATRIEPSRSTMLPVQTIIYLEFCATLVSLAGPLCRLNEASGRQSLLPKKISLPSPSHSPSLVDVLPMPSAVSELFRVRPSVSPAAVPPFRTRQRLGTNWGPPNSGHRSLIAVTGAHVDLDTAAQSDNQATRRLPPPAHTASGINLADPLRLPASGKAPRLTGMRVRVETTWFMENVVTLFGHLVGALQYMIIALSLPTLAPTSFPSLLSLLSLRSELGAVTSTWSSARKSIECLEFVRRRWRAKVRAEEVTGDIVEDEDDGMLCPICFESVQTPTQACMQEAIEDCCTLDCSHRLHSICLVQWLTKQAFCPCCHATLRATPPHMRADVDGQQGSSTSSRAAAAA